MNPAIKYVILRKQRGLGAFCGDQRPFCSALVAVGDRGMQFRPISYLLSRLMASSTARLMNAFTDSPCLAACSWMMAFFPLGTRKRMSSTFSDNHLSRAFFCASVGAIFIPPIYNDDSIMRFALSIDKMHIYGSGFWIYDTVYLCNIPY